MSEIDWSKAPEWATVLLKHLYCTSTAWASSHADGAKAVSIDPDGVTFELVAHVWHVVAKRPSPAWSGEGLPPVGAAVDCKCTAKTKARDWFPAEVKYISPYTVVLVDYSTDELDGEFVAHPATLLFQPRRTPEKIAADERADTIKRMREIWHAQDGCMGKLYDAGLRFVAEPKP